MIPPDFEYNEIVLQTQRFVRYSEKTKYSTQERSVISNKASSKRLEVSSDLAYAYRLNGLGDDMLSQGLVIRP